MKSQELVVRENVLTIQYRITRVSGFAEIWECTSTHEKSLHATVKFMPGDIISSLEAKEILSEPNYFTVQFSDREHIMFAPDFLHYINHSCNPNVFFDTTNGVVICLKKIKVGEEMTFFYPSTEWSMNRGFVCRCNAPECLGKIQGAAHLRSDILQKYRLTDYIRGKLNLA